MSGAGVTGGRFGGDGSWVTAVAGGPQRPAAGARDKSVERGIPLDLRGDAQFLHTTDRNSATGDYHSAMRPSERFFLNRDDVYLSRRARQRAKWLYDTVWNEVVEAKELSAIEQNKRKSKIFPPRRWRPAFWLREEHPIEISEWKIVAEVAEQYPRLLTWLAEGQVGVLWNVFGTWVAVLRLIPGVRWLLWWLVFNRVAGGAAWRVGLYESILQEVRKQCNDGPSPAGTERIPREGIPGLSAVNDEPLILTTKAGKELDIQLGTMSSGCVGISGLRGAGKSALLQDYCAHRYGTPRVPFPEKPEHFLPGLRLMVQAPLRFEAREFLIHQYSCLCEAVLADVRFNATTLGRQLLLPFTPGGRLRLAALVGTLSGAIFFSACAFLAFLAAHGTWPSLPADLTNWEITGATLSGVAGLLAMGWQTKRAAREVRQVVNLASDAESRLQRLHYQRTDTRTAGGALTVPTGSGITIGSSHEFTQQQMTLPELIDDYRDFVQRVVGGLQQAEFQRRNRSVRRHARQRAWADGKDWAAARPWLQRALQLPAPAAPVAPRAWPWPRNRPRPGHPEDDLGTDIRLIIGIDQMDQIDNPGAACKFLNELSAEFGIGHCVYLLAVSPGTMAAGNHRMVPAKTASAGVFDEMAWVEPFSIKDSAALLRRRVIGLPPVLIALCYVLSGGLPRELLRVARCIVRAVQDPLPGRGIEAADVIQAVLEEEVKALKHRALASAVGADVSTMPALMRELTDEGWPWTTALAEVDAIDVDIRDQAELPPALLSGTRLDVTAGGDEAALAVDVRESFASDLYYMFTVLSWFKSHQSDVARTAGDRLAVDAPEVRFWPYYDEPDPLVGLARARITLGINPGLAAELVTKVRQVLRKQYLPEAAGAPPNGAPAEDQAETRSQTKMRVSLGLIEAPAPRLP
jgi:hypothetical protein